MRTFKDSAGRSWTIVLNVDAIKRVRSLLKIDLTKVLESEDPLLPKLTEDVILLCDVIYALVKPDADQAKVSDEDFGRAMGGDAITMAHEAFLGELSDFFSSRRRSELVKAIQAQQRMVAAAIKLAEKKLDSLDVEAEVSRIYGGLSTSAPPSPA